MGQIPRSIERISSYLYSRQIWQQTIINLYTLPTHKLWPYSLLETKDLNDF